MDCKIDIKEIGSGEYNYKFLLDTSFFESFGGDLISGARLDVGFILTKSADSAWMKVDCNMSGQVEVECDRCLAELTIPVEIDKSFTINFVSSNASEEEGEYDVDVIVLDQRETELDMGQAVYDYVALSLPIKKVHKDGECDPVMLERMKDILKENKNIE